MRASVRPLASRAVSLLLLAALLGWSGFAGADPVRYRIQPEASEVTFKATSRLMNADGRFGRMSGEVTVEGENPATARISVTVEAASIDTGIGMRDNHLRSEDFFEVKRFPAIAFESSRVEVAGKRAVVFGRLSIHGVTREVTIPVEVALSPAALVASGEFVVDRRECGLTYQSYLNPIGNEVRVAFTFRARTP